MSLNDLPTELLLNILSFLDNLDHVSSTNRTLSTTSRDLQVSQLRGKLAQIPHADLLMRIWSPPSFFRRDGYGRRQTQHVHASQPQDLINMLCDPAVVPRVEAYIDSLHNKARVAQQVAEFLVTMVSFNGFRNHDDRMSFASTVVIHLWSAQQRYSHDTDGYIASLLEGYVFRDLCARDQYLMDLSADTQGWLVACYNALSQYLRPPFVRREQHGEGMWLQRAIARGGMQAVLGMLHQRAGRH
ncbi:hypothetical protein BZA05DRAFT_1498 [Tricharina praecox]|uniref:uncharacterized protein n=1 Tax=Tricharina praecox TaxID=43433 RepID=UPI0022202EC5|nr:uncharacterized protein BZA05DRAFT_1498 [Tricharina praecox]KAI5858380.1 hypothetical protein BZA05DRAFT_1498 [Tricharina praecox]